MFEKWSEKQISKYIQMLKWTIQISEHIYDWERISKFIQIQNLSSKHWKYEYFFTKENWTLIKENKSKIKSSGNMW